MHKYSGIFSNIPTGNKFSSGTVVPWKGLKAIHLVVGYSHTACFLSSQLL